MPQMMPLNWLTLMIFFILMFLMFNILNFYFFNFSSKKSNILTNLKMINWKW